MPSPSEVLPSHLEILVPEQWAIWRWFVVRGAGFPADLIDRLAQPGCATAADELIRAGDALEEHFRMAIRDFDSTLDRFTAAGIPREDERFKAVLRARRILSGRKIPNSNGLPPELLDKLQAIRLAGTELDRMRPQFEDRFAQGIEDQGEALRAFACDERFQEAIVWQNREAFVTAIQPVMHGLRKSVRNQHQRTREHLIARYAQRYCVKNDSIGFFGPVVWGRVEPHARVFEMKPGEMKPGATKPGGSLIAQRQTYFEAWPIYTLAGSLSTLQGIEWWIPPRLAPDIALENGMLLRPGASPLKLTELEHAVLSLCNGENLPGKILQEIRKNPDLAATDEQELRGLLRDKSGEGILTWRWMVPVEVNSEINLRRQLARIGDPGLRDAAMDRLEKLVAARDEVRQSAGNPARLHAAMRQAEAVFEQITDSPAHRNAGGTYAARSLLYEDCRRDLSLEISPQLLAPIVPALALLLKSLRWFMQATALEFNRMFHETYQEMAARNPEGTVRLLDWWIETEPRLIDAPSIAAIEKSFRQAWETLLPSPPGSALLQFESGRLQPEVDRLFPDLGPGYYPVRYFCPDLMLAAKDADAIRRGELLYVLGEVHAGKNSLIHAALMEHHPAAHELVAATQWDLAASCFKIVSPQEVENAIVRTVEGVLRPEDFMVATTPDSIAPSGYDSHRIGQLVLERQEGELYAVDRLQQKRFHILAAFSDMLFGFVMNKAFWVQPLRHAPRILIDNLVLHRESWRFRRHELAFALEKDEARRFLEARRWMKQNGLPRKTFVRSPSEIKPFYLDMESPILVEGLCRAIHHMKPSPESSEEIAFSEMLPGAGDLWLRDAAGNSYTSELRFAIVDLEARERSQPENQRHTSTTDEH